MGLVELNVRATVVNSIWLVLRVVFILVNLTGNTTVVVLLAFWMVISAVLVVVYVALLVLLVSKIVVLTNADETKRTGVVVIVA